jgi:hypothetical protein
MRHQPAKAEPGQRVEKRRKSTLTKDKKLLLAALRIWELRQRGIF